MNLFKKINALEVLNNLYFKYDGRLTINYYKKIIDMNNNFIEMEEVIVKGENLIILYLDSFTITIKGKIKEICIK